MAESAPEIVKPDSAPAADELAAFKDRHLRLQAEFENFRKRKNREAEEMRQYAAVPVLQSLLPILDNFRLALDTAHDPADPKWAEGIALIARHLTDTLKLHGLEEIPVSPGDAYDHTWHEAVTTTVSESVPAGRVAAVLRPGYKVRDRLIRAAQVAVAAGAEPGPDTAPAEAE